MASNLVYPPARRGDEVLTVGKYSVPDPYQHFEQLESNETAEFIKAQNKVSFSCFDGKGKERIVLLTAMKMSILN